MHIWFLFHVSILILSRFYLCLKGVGRKYVMWSIILILIYFSTFRDGLGSDYLQYVYRIEDYDSIDAFMLGFLKEPLFGLISVFINYTILSPIFLFFICALVTNIGFSIYIFKDNKYVFWSLMLYVFLSTMYSQSFNIIRQFFSVGLFLLALNYVGKSLLKYLALIFVAVMMHTSAIILLPFYWLLKIQFKIKYIVPSLLLLISFSLLLFPYFSILGGKYLDSVNSDMVMSNSGMIIFYNLLFVLLLFNRKMYCDLDNISRNLFIFFILTIDLSYINISFYRLSYYFFPVILTIIPYILHRLLKKDILNYMAVFCLIILFYTNLLLNVNDSTIVPSKILPISSIFDNVYKFYF